MSLMYVSISLQSTIDDECQNGECVGTPVNCDDDNLHDDDDLRDDDSVLWDLLSTLRPLHRTLKAKTADSWATHTS